MQNANQFPKQSSTGPQKDRRRVSWWWYLTWLLLISWLLPSLMGGGSQSGEAISYSTFLAQVNANNVKSVTITDYSVTGVFKSAVPSQDGSTKSTQFSTTVPNFGNGNLIGLLQEHQVSINVQSSSTASFWLNVILFVGPLVLILLFMWWMSRRVTSTQNGLFSFARSRARLYMGDGKTQTTFADVAGVDEAKAELVEVVDFLRSPERYQRLGGKIPRGILLVGPQAPAKPCWRKLWQARPMS